MAEHGATVRDVAKVEIARVGRVEATGGRCGSQRKPGIAAGCPGTSREARPDEAMSYLY